MKLSKLDRIRRTVRVWDKLKKISKSISNLDCAGCNYQLTQRQETRRINLIKEADSLAKDIGLKIYHQGDPRGCSLYLVDNTTDRYDYNKGIAIY